MKRYLLTRPAERDLDHIRHYLVERAGARLARRVMNEIRSGPPGDDAQLFKINHAAVIRLLSRLATPATRKQTDHAKYR